MTLSDQCVISSKITLPVAELSSTFPESSAPSRCNATSSKIDANVDSFNSIFSAGVVSLAWTPGGTKELLAQAFFTIVAVVCVEMSCTGIPLQTA